MQKNKPIVIGAALLGILAIGLTLMSLLGGRTPSPAPAPAATPEPAKQLVASRTIPPRTVVTSDMVREDSINSPVTGGLTDSKLVVGKLTGDIVHQGDVFTPAVLVEPLARAKPANFAVPAGLRAVAIMVDPNATVGGIVDIGDRVDVVVMHRLKYKNEADQDGETRSGRTIGQNLLVLATDAALKKADTPPPAPAAAPTDPNAPPPPPTPPPAPTPAPAPGTPVAKVRVVVAASPGVAERLVAAQGMGEIHLTLRDGIGQDQAAVPEVMEYPVYTLGRRTPVKTAGGGGGGSASNIFKPQAPPSAIMPPQYPQTMVPPASPSGAMQPASAEVTVIRGTEKSKVEVPQR